VAIYHCNVKGFGRAAGLRHAAYTSGSALSRTGGRSVVAAAAYRGGLRLHDQERDIVFDYSGRADSVHDSFIVVPPGSPDWARNREELWNRAELHEKEHGRKNVS